MRSAAGRQDGGYRVPVLAEPRGGPIPKPREVAAAAESGRDDDPQQQAWAAAVAAFLASWPALSAPLVAALVGQVEFGPGVWATLTVPQPLLDDIAAALEQAMADAALDAAVAEAGAAQAQGVAVDPPTPDERRLAGVAGVTAALIGVAYIAAATRRALQVGPEAAAGAVREVLDAMGTATSGVVADHVGVAIGAAQNAGRRAVFEAHPPARLVADESHDDPARCGPCHDINGHVYDTVDAALADYPTSGYARCLGRGRCRGRLRAEWS